jgi:hypothetical protein
MEMSLYFRAGRADGVLLMNVARENDTIVIGAGAKGEPCGPCIPWQGQLYDIPLTEYYL